MEAKKIAAMAETYQMGVAPHNPLGPVANAVALHFALSTPNFLIQEDMLTDVPWRWDVVRSSLRTENGYWLPAQAPGLGIEVDEEQARKHPFQQEVMHSTMIRLKTERCLIGERKRPTRAPFAGRFLLGRDQSELFFRLRLFGLLRRSFNLR